VSLHNPSAGWISPDEDPETAREEVAAFLPRAAALYPVSDWLARQLAPPPPLPPITVIRGHADVALFSPAALDGRRWPATVLFAGKLDPRKGLDVLLDALDQAALHGWRLAICAPLPPVSGFEPWREGILGRLEAHHRVDLLLPRFEAGELARLYARATVVAVPTVGEEALGLVSIEAQACGTPVVVSDSGGLPETLDPGETGWIVPRGDVASLAHAIAKARTLRGDPRGFATANFSLQRRLHDLEAAYHRL
jgi:glycosyltransferase involved in cell wall biosynthesis